MNTAPSNPRLKERLESLVAEMIDKGILLNEASTQFEKQFIQKALRLNDDNISRTSEMIGIHRNTLSKKIALYKL